MYQNVWEDAKAMLVGKCIVQNAYIRQKKKF